ncbi:MAG: S46 family peptidase [Acidobacteria bacterium]|nr:S46 family peptidase [Acidobacteriota bacterium]
MKKTLIVLMMVFTAAAAFAVEGMFPLNELHNLDKKKLQKMGLQIPLSEIKDDVSKAVVSLGGGSGSFVSKDGLIVTNHHVAYGAVQYNSGPKHDYITNGFYAPTFDKELPAPGYYADIILNVKDVTSIIKKAVKKGMTDKERFKAIEEAIKKLESEVEKNNPHIRASVASMYQGRQYLLFTKLRLLDIRLVYAPPQAIGNFGGDVDNFEWPRHTGDFSFLRAYVAPDGTPAAYSKKNVPFHPKHFLTISIKPLKKGDFTFILGFPGSTNRYMTAEQLDFYLNKQIPLRLKLFHDIIDRLNAIGSESRENHIRVAFWVKMLNNSMKYYQGVYDGLHRDKAVSLFRTRDANLEKWIEKCKSGSKYKGLIPAINQINDKFKPIANKLTIMGYMRLIPTFSAAGTLTRWAEEKTKPDLERDPAYMNRNIQRMEMRLKSMQRNLLVKSDVTLMKYFLHQMANLPKDQWPETFKKTFGNVNAADLSKAIDKKVDEMYTKTGLTKTAARMKYFSMSAKELAKVNDPLLKFGGEFANEIKTLRDQNESLAGALSRLKPQFIDLIHAYTHNELYPDANGTIRFTYGSIMGYSPREAVWYRPFTTLAGVVQKETGKKPFASPKKLLELYKNKDFGSYGDPALGGNVPVDFLTDNDTTGGNSGSPTLNGKGQLIGLLFDGNYESISADYYFNPALTRSIVADADYMIFILDKFSNAQNLIHEMTIVR